ncbi:MAG: hypothetical protein ACOYCB_13775 [Fastidiosipilaceae bacterium]|jgi:dnd system-associated protein 4
MKSTLNRAQRFETSYQNLGNRPDIQLFTNMKEVYMVALLVGFLSGRRIPIDKISEPIKMNIFDANDKNIMDIIALCKKGDLSLLINEDECVNEKLCLIEEYANGGMELIEKNICIPMPNFEALKSLIESFDKKDDKNIKVDIADIIAAAIKDLDCEQEL